MLGSQLLAVLITALCVQAYAYPRLFGPSLVDTEKRVQRAYPRSERLFCPDDHCWQAPQRSDARSPCPGLNTLANHGYLPRNGKQISSSTLSNALQTTFHFSQAMADSMVGSAFVLLGYDLTTDPGAGLSLAELIGSPLTHPASLIHADDITEEGSDWRPKAKLFSKYMADSRGSDLINTTSQAISRLRRDRESQAAGSPPIVYNGSDITGVLALGEVALILLVMGQLQEAAPGKDPVEGWVLPKSWADDWLMQNKLPAKWKRSEDPITSEQQRALSAIIYGYMQNMES